MSTASLPPERRSEIASNASKARKTHSGVGRKPSCTCGICQRCKARGSEQRSRAKRAIG